MAEEIIRVNDAYYILATSTRVDDRRRVLKHVVEEYVRTATPVSSDVIVRRYEPSVSSATVRNELLR